MVRTNLGVLLISLFLLLSCSGNSMDSGAGMQDAMSDPAVDAASGCENERAEVWVSAEDVDPALRLVDSEHLLMAVGVRALRGCEDLEGPLAAMNWWTIRDQAANNEYTSVVAPLLLEMGAKIILSSSGYTTLMAPEGTVPDGSPWLQERLDLPLYPTAEHFAGMLASEAWLRVGGYKLTETNDMDYDFVFQRCLHGCEEILAKPFIAWPPGSKMVHFFNATQEETRDAVASLKTALESSALATLYFAGYAWALPVVRFEEIGVPEVLSNGFWNDGTFLIVLASGAEAEAVLALDAYREFLSVAENNTVVLFD